jgi:hypothetical protein
MTQPVFATEGYVIRCGLIMIFTETPMPKAIKITCVDITPARGFRAGSGNLNNPDKWKFCLNAA